MIDWWTAASFVMGGAIFIAGKAVTSALEEIQQKERIRHQNTIDAMIRQAVEQRRQEIARNSIARPARVYTEEQQAAIFKARKIAAQMGSDSQGVRSNAKSALDAILRKHALTESDL